MASVHQWGVAQEAHQAAPGTSAHQSAYGQSLEGPGKQVATRAGTLVDDHDLRAGDDRARGGQGGTPAQGEIRALRPGKEVEDVIRVLAAAVEALVDDEGLARGLREEVAFHELVAVRAGVGQVDVAYAATTGFGHAGEVPLHQIPHSQFRLVLDRLHRHGSGPCAAGVRSHRELGDRAGGVLEGAEDVGGGVQRPAVHGQQVVALVHVSAWLGERRVQARYPVGSAIDSDDAVPAVLHGVVGAEQAYLQFGAGLRKVASGDVVVADPQLAEQPLEQPVEVRASGQVREEGGVLHAHGVPVQAVHAGIVEVVAVDAPGVLVHLRPLGPWVHEDLDAVERQPALVGRGLAGGGDHGPRFAGLQQHLAVVGGELVGGHVLGDRLFAQRIQVEVGQLVGSGLLRAFEVVDLAGRTLAQVLVHALGQGERLDAVGEAHQIYAHPAPGRERGGRGRQRRRGASRHGFLIVAAGQRRGSVRLQHGKVERVGALHVLGGHVHVPFGGARVGGTEEVQEAPARVEGRAGDLGQPVGHPRGGEGLQ